MSIESLREELHECIDSYGTSDAKTIEKSQELDRALNESVMLEQEVVYYMKRTVQAERLLREVEGFCPMLYRIEIKSFLDGLCVIERV